MKGFAHPDYAASLAEFGAPRALPNCEGWILERPIAGFRANDAMGCYPLFACRDWTQLSRDLNALEDELVCLSMVSDPFGRYDETLLKDCFQKVIPFKEHYVADLTAPRETFVTRHHRKYARKALRSLSIEICEEPILFIDEWTELYEELTKKFSVSGVRAFSRKAFTRQLTIPGAVLFRALNHGKVVAAHLLLLQDRVCYGHLVGITAMGQDLLASYALYWSELEYFVDKADWLDWGAGAGVKTGNSDGLTQFKSGWSTETRTSYFCGRIFDHEKYEEIIKSFGIGPTDYFPAYRQGEYA